MHPRHNDLPEEHCDAHGSSHTRQSREVGGGGEQLFTFVLTVFFVELTAFMANCHRCRLSPAGTWLRENRG